MTLSATGDAARDHPNQARGLGARLNGLISIVISIGLALTPVTAVLVLGWFMRIMRRETAIALYRYGVPEKSRSELQFARLLAAAEQDVVLTLSVPEGYAPRTTSSTAFRCSDNSE